MINRHSSPWTATNLAASPTPVYKKQWRLLADGRMSFIFPTDTILLRGLPQMAFVDLRCSAGNLLSIHRRFRIDTAKR
jgi:hypothetical protein